MNKITQRWIFASCALMAALPIEVQAQDSGRIVGRVLSSHAAQPLAAARVYLSELSEGTLGALTAVDGRYVIRNVPAGVHSVTVQLIGYATKTVTDVEVTPRQTATLDINLEQQAIALSAITVTSTAERSSTTALLRERRLSVVVSDGIGAEQISRSPDGDAASALRRVPGLSVVDGKYAYVRGLGERYSGTTLNGAPLASPEPDKRVIPLDMIPSGLLESIITSKSYSPDQPGDYAGGLVQLRTRDFPSNMILDFSASTGWSSVASFKDRLGYAGGGMDFLGFDDGTRGIPSIIPRDTRVSVANFSPQQLQEMGRAFQGDWAPTPTPLPPNVGLNLSFGDDYDLDDDGRLGLIASASYSSDHKVQSDLVENGFNAAGPTDPLYAYTGEVADRAVTIGGLLNLTFQPRSTDQFKLSAIYNHKSNDQSQLLEGYNADKNTDLRQFRIQFLEQSLLNAQLEGEHLLGFLHDATWRWRGGYTRAARYEPSTRQSVYEEDNTDGMFRWTPTVLSGSVFHQDMVDDGFTGGTSLRLPFELRDESAALTVGGSFELKERSAYTRRFRFGSPGSLVDATVRTYGPNELFGTGTYIDPNGFQLQEHTDGADNYDATQDLGAAFALLDLEILDGLRASGGVRMEHSDQRVRPLGILGTGTLSAQADLTSTDILPALNVTLALNDRMNLRAGASRTLARPHLRELAPFAFADYFGGYLVLGNPFLDETHITNVDLRFEWFRTPRSVLAVSTFFKDFEDPIEDAVLLSTELRKTWVNARGGRNYGVELEMRSPLDVVTPSLEDVTLNANLTLVRSRVSTGGTVDMYLGGLGSTQIVLQERDRALQGQSPYVLNVGLTWAPVDGASATVLFNRFGERINAIGAQGIPDVYEEARNQFDAVLEWPFVGGWSAKVSGSRLLGNVIEFTQGGGVLRSYDAGRSVSFGLSWGAGR